MNTPYRRNTAGQLIEAPTKVSGISNTTIGAAAFTAITAPADCKRILVKSRTDVAWKLSDILAGTTYMTVGATETLVLDFAAASGATLFFAASSGGDIVLEVVALD